MDSLAQDMATKNAFYVPNTFGRATILLEANKDIKECFIAGIIELDLNYFSSTIHEVGNACGGMCNFSGLVLTLYQTHK